MINGNKNSAYTNRRPRQPMMETLERRTLLSGAPATGLTVARGYPVTQFAVSPVGDSQPDSIAVTGTSVFVAYQNGGLPDGSDGKSSSIVQYSVAGTVLRTYSVPGHNDGLKVDPTTGLLWSMQNEDANPNLVIINPTAGTQTQYTFAAAPLAGGGYDDIAFVGGNVYFTASNPANNPNTLPAVVQATLSGTSVSVKTVLLGNATATHGHKKVTLNLQDPDSMTVDPAGRLVFTSQADNELITIANPGAANQSASLLPLTDARHKPVSVDDTLFPPSASGEILLSDTKAGVVYAISAPATKGLVLSAAADIGQLGKVNLKTGAFRPVLSGFAGPHGLAFLAFGLTVARGFSITPFATGPVGSSQPDSIVASGNTVFVGFQNHGAPDGSGGATSTIVQYNSAGAVLKTWTVAGHNDGLKVDPSTGLLWAMQNEDATPSLVIIDPTTATQTLYTFDAAPLAGGGYDDITFLGGKVYFSASNPANNPNNKPAIVQATLSGTTVSVSTVLLGDATATDGHKKVSLNLQDPDSMTSDSAGELVMTSQADNELVFVKNAGAANQSVRVLPLTGASHKAVSVDDTLFLPRDNREIFATDTSAGVIYAITGSSVKTNLTLSAAPDIGQLGKTNVKSGRFMPVISGLIGPHGLASM